jgi:hypothetical protein
MNALPQLATFDGWVRWVFDHPVADHEWYWDDKEWPDANNEWPYKSGIALPAAASVLQHMTQLFESPTRLIGEYSLAQLNQGLWFIASGMWRPMTTIADADLPLADRQRCVRSFESLYRLLFAAHCDDRLSHGVSETSNPLNTVCYMWWDLLPYGDFVRLVDDEGRDGDWRDLEDLDSLHEKVDDAELASLRPIHETMLDTMSRILQHDHIACREGALHGLGHFHEHYPVEVEKIIRTFLQESHVPDSVLRAYAEAAAKGAVQ